MVNKLQEKKNSSSGTSVSKKENYIVEIFSTEKTKTVKELLKELLLKELILKNVELNDL